MMTNSDHLSTRFALVGGLFSFLAVAFGAFGAHALKSRLSENMLAVFNTAVDYQVFHALAILFLACFVGGKSPQLQRDLSLVFYCFLFGVLVFCGSLYALSITGIKWLGAITPIGGTAFLIGWGWLLFGLYKSRSDYS